jgi:hypothetical protein
MRIKRLREHIQEVCHENNGVQNIRKGRNIQIIEEIFPELRKDLGLQIECVH